MMTDIHIKKMEATGHVMDVGTGFAHGVRNAELTCSCGTVLHIDFNPTDAVIAEVFAAHIKAPRNDTTTQPVTSNLMQPGDVWKFVYWNYDEKQNIDVFCGSDYVTFSNENGDVVRLATGQLRDLLSRLPKHI